MKLKKINTQLVALLLGCLGGLDAFAQNLPGWTLVWADEFTQADGTPPDSTKWGYDIGGWGWGNNELETYTSRTNNARIEGGQLVIEARQENFTGTDNIPRNYTSARLLTKGKWSWTYGRIEARIKIPRGQGIWPAFWMLGANIDSVQWPNCGEIDIMENIGSVTNRVYGTIHGPGYSGGSSIGGSLILPGGGAYADDFHVFAVEWETNRIRWYMDGQLYFTATPASLPNGATWVFTQPQFILLNVAVGGDWPGPPNGSTTFPQRMTVDYVRVYSVTNVPGCGGNALVNPGFEVGGLANWTTYGNAFLGSISSLPVHGGSNVFKVYGQFSGGENYSGVFQDVASTPGTNNTANAWALTPSGDQIAGGNTAWVEVSFRNVAASILSLYRTALITPSTPAGVWLNLAVTNQLNPATSAVIGSVTNLVAPTGTAFVRYQVVFRQPAFAAGSVLFDDLNLLIPGATASPVSASAAKTGDNLSISFPTFLGVNYQLRYKNDLSDSTWQVLTNLTGDGQIKVVVDPLNLDRRFYQVFRVCN